jgi:hypothetical protein
VLLKEMPELSRFLAKTSLMLRGDFVVYRNNENVPDRTDQRRR